MSRLGIPLAVAAVIATVSLATASATPPPASAPIRASVTHMSPVAGQWFTGITLANMGARIDWIRCAATVDHRTVAARVQRFYGTPGSVPAGPYLAAVSCSWKIPANGAGRLLRGTVYAGTSGQFAGPGVQSWRIAG